MTSSTEEVWVLKIDVCKDSESYVYIFDSRESLEQYVFSDVLEYWAFDDDIDKLRVIHMIRSRDFQSLLGYIHEETEAAGGGWGWWIDTWSTKPDTYRGFE